MRVMATGHVITDAELLGLPRDGCKYEIVDGEIKAMSPATPEHERLIMALGSVLRNFVRERRLGEVYGSNTLFMVRPNRTGRSPDVVFVSAAKHPLLLEQGSTIKILTIPDLVVEVQSPFETEGEINEKVRDYLTAGVPSVWVIRMDRTATLHQQGRAPQALGQGDVLNDEAVLPGFSCPLAVLFESGF